MLSLWAVFVAGLVGSAHCAGMCGGFALALGALPGSDAYAGRLAAYLAGKTLTYAALGALAGAFGLALFFATPYQNGISIGFGLALVVLGVGLCRGGAATFGRAGAWLSAPLGRLVGRGTTGSAFGLGLLNGVLPCGLVAAFLVQAASTGSPARGALVLGVFGLSTIPALVLTGTLGRMARPAFRRRLQVAGGALVMLVGAITIARATPAMAYLAHHAPGLHHHLEVSGPVCRVP